MRSLSATTAPELLVGALSGDDAAVWQIDDRRALVLTADFITPVVDDPFSWGQVAAANSVSDVYAMGARPLLALNLICWNTAELPRQQLEQVLAGGDYIAQQAQMVIAGGHTVDDPEPKYGMVVVGEVDPNSILTNAGLKAGQALIVTKPLGIGIITTGLKLGKATESSVTQAVGSMITLNAEAAKIALDHGATGATDVTGFGLLGHLGRAAQESSVNVEIVVENVPIIQGARELAADGVVPSGTGRNLDWVRNQIDKGDGVSDLDITLLADAQTSGGLVFGVDPGKVVNTLAALETTKHHAALIGTTAQGTGKIKLTRQQQI